MPIVTIHNAFEGASALLEYRGTASAVVLLVPFASTGTNLDDIALALARNQALQGWMNQGLASPVWVQLLPAIVGMTDCNGFFHKVTPLAGLLSAGHTLRVDATEVA